MEHIAHRIADIARNIEIVGADPITLHGFTQVPNFVLVKKDISVGAKGIIVTPGYFDEMKRRIDNRRKGAHSIDA